MTDFKRLLRLLASTLDRGLKQLLCRLIANRLREIDEGVVGWRIHSGERNEASSA